jgi:hypothetical protein
MGSGGIPWCILNLGASWRWVASFTPRPLYPRGKNFRYPLDRRMGESQSRYGRGGKEKNSYSGRESNPNSPACGLVAIPTELSRLVKHPKLPIQIQILNTCNLCSLPGLNTRIYRLWSAKETWFFRLGLGCRDNKTSEIFYARTSRYWVDSLQRPRRQLKDMRTVI